MIVGSLFQTTSPLAYIPMIVSGLKPFDPAQLNPDVWFDASALDTMFIERSGAITPAYAGSPVGMMLDKRLTKGAELYTGQTMSVDQGAAGTEFAVDQSLRKVEVTKAGANPTYPRINFNLGLVPDKYYIVRGRMAKTGDTPYPQNIRLNTIGSDNNLTTNTVTGEFYGIQKAGSVFINFMMNGTLLGSLSIVELSVKEMIHPIAIASTDAARPTLARMPKTGRRNLLTYTEDLTASPWAAVSVIKSANNLVATAVSSQHRIDRTITVPIGAIYSAIVKSAGLRYVGVRFDNDYTWFDLTTGTIIGNTNGNAGIAAIDGGSFKIWATNANTEKTVLRVNISDIVYVNNAFVGDGVSGVEIHTQQLEIGGVVTPYQKVTNAFDVTEAGVPDVWSMEYDGVDDYMTFAPITIPDGYTLFASHDLALQQLGLISSVETACGWWLPPTPLGRNVMRASGANDWVFGLKVPSTTSKAVSMVSSKGKARWNGAEQELVSSIGAIKPLNLPLSQIGRRGNSTNYAKGKFMGIMVFNRELSDTEILLIEKHMADKAGVTL